MGGLGVGGWGLVGGGWGGGGGVVQGTLSINNTVIQETPVAIIEAVYYGLQTKHQVLNLFLP